MVTVWSKLFDSSQYVFVCYFLMCDVHICEYSWAGLVVHPWICVGNVCLTALGCGLKLNVAVNDQVCHAVKMAGNRNATLWLHSRKWSLTASCRIICGKKAFTWDNLVVLWNGPFVFRSKSILADKVESLPADPQAARGAVLKKPLGLQASLFTDHRKHILTWFSLMKWTLPPGKCKSIICFDIRKSWEWTLTLCLQRTGQSL